MTAARTVIGGPDTQLWPLAQAIRKIQLDKEAEDTAQASPPSRHREG